jgi:predicted dehydrogenase
MNGQPQVRAAVVGSGAFGRTHLRTLASMPEAEVAGVHALALDQAAALCETYGGQVYTSLDALAADASVDLVTIATPEDAHAEIFCQLVAAGKAVYIEKPLATTVADARRMVADSANAIAMSGHCLRFESRLARLAADRDAYGPLRHMRFANFRSRDEKDVYGRVHPVWSMLCHEIELGNAYAGAPATRVLARDLQFSDGQADGMSILVEYANGVTASIEGGWLLPAAAAVAENDRCSFFFDLATVEIALPHTGFTVTTAAGMRPANQQYEHAVHGVEYGALRAAFAYMATCIRDGQQPQISTIADGCGAALVAATALRSAQAGTWAAVDEPEDSP